MTVHKPPLRVLRPALSTPLVLLSTLLVVLALLPLSLSLASAQPVSPNPLLIQAALLPEPTDQITVVGDGFTPGGIVYITVTDRLDTDVLYNGWTFASTGTFGMNGSMDPALGYVEGGTINDLVILDSNRVVGPHEGHDPARNTSSVMPFLPTADYASVSFPERAAAIPSGPLPNLNLQCDSNLQVQAFDAHTLTRSNRIEVIGDC